MSEEQQPNMTTPVPESPAGDDAHNGLIAERFLIGDLIKAATRQMKELQVAFPLLTEAEQGKVLQRVLDDVKPAVLKAVQIIKDHGRVQFPAECASVKFNGPTDVQATMKMVAHSGAHMLADFSGRTVTIVIDELDAILNPGDSIKGDPDQKELLDDNAPL